MSGNILVGTSESDTMWSIVHHVEGNIGGTRKICQLCNLERLAIAAEDKHQLLNKREYISNNCTHNRPSYSINAPITSQSFQFTHTYT